MTWLNYITLNSVAPVANLHQISDAGAGEGLMQLHPTRDTELIVCGRANTRLNGQYLPSPVVGNGSVTPAILVHGLFRALQDRGFKIRVHCYQLGLDSRPDFTDAGVDEVVTHHCNVGEEATLIDNSLLPELKRQKLAGEEHIIAESGIGGTTFATLWLRRWIEPALWFAGSTQDTKKLAVKSQLLEKLWTKTAGKACDVEAYVGDLECSDPVQRAVCRLLGSDIASLNLAGGAMMFAAVVAMQSKLSDKHVEIATTRWVMESDDACLVGKHLSHYASLLTHKTDFTLSKFDAIRMYERGYVVEGCGLGGCLTFAENHGLSQQEIINCLDAAVSPWIETRDNTLTLDASNACPAQPSDALA
ncbi:hypothetical protein [Thaumasiovibrio sp. DFM-14]|uniref:hypothetical protein n=1 Tax=Thaumasiovibrio sp. DFM-14 TaxID=3384792 RepID=UPI0039A2F2C7